jgi:hypothetical protein
VKSTEEIKKTFLMTVSLNESPDLKTIEYDKSLGFGAKSIEAINPIIPLIAHVAGSGDRIKVIAICTKIKEVERNYPEFIRELDKHKSDMGFEYDLVRIDIDRDQSFKTQKYLYKQIFENLGDNECLYAESTFGERPILYVIEKAINRAYRMRNNFYVENISYLSYYDRKNKRGTLYDISRMFMIDNVMVNMSRSEGSKGLFEALLDYDDDDDDMGGVTE